MGINTRKMKYPAAICVLLACCITMDIASYAAGWAEENGTWRYSGQSGDYITNSWIRHGNSYYYLDEKGEMATECLIKTDGDLYYVDINGVKAVNQWVSISDDNSQGGTQAATAWYYFGSKGKAYRNIRKRIDGKYYIFDENGHMLSGWQPYGNNDNLYYLGTADEGWAHIGWQNLESHKNEPGTYWYYFGTSGISYQDTKKKIDGRYYIFDEDGQMLSGWQSYDGDDNLYYLGTGDEGWARTGWQNLEPGDDASGSDDSEEWFYFNPGSGKAYRDTRKKIDGSYYTFDEDGVMQDKWLSGRPAIPDSLPDDSNARYREEEGSLEGGWYYGYGPEDKDESGEEGWYYLDKNGVPFNDQGRDSSGNSFVKELGDGGYFGEAETGMAAKVIHGKTYLFDENGRMMTGYYYLVSVNCEGGPTLGVNKTAPDYGYNYYFNADSGSKEGQMMTGKQSFLCEGDRFHCYLRNDGRAYAGMIVDGCLYDFDGLRLESRDGSYKIIEIGPGLEIAEKGSSRLHKNCLLVVNKNGKLKKSGTVKIGGQKYTIKDYEAIEVTDD